VPGSKFKAVNTCDKNFTRGGLLTNAVPLPSSENNSDPSLGATALCEALFV